MSYINSGRSGTVIVGDRDVEGKRRRRTSVGRWSVGRVFVSGGGRECGMRFCVFMLGVNRERLMMTRAYVL